MSSTPAEGGRIESVDAFRGFALAGIVIVHVVEQYLGSAMPRGVEHAATSPLDPIVSGLVLFLLQGKFFALFAMLFGISFFIMMDGAARKGAPFAGRFVWRLVLLFGFGLIDLAFYRADILTAYAFIGLALPLFYRVPSRALLVTAAILFIGIGRYAAFGIFGESIFGTSVLSNDTAVARDFYATVVNGSFAAVASDNLRTGAWMKLEALFGTFGRGYLTLGFFLVGLCLGRIRLFARIEHFAPAIKKAARVALGAHVLAFVALFGIKTTLFGSAEPRYDQLGGMVLMSFWDLAGVTLTALILCLFLLAFRRRPDGLLAKLAPFGRMALTNYVVQSIVGTFFFYGWGLGRINTLSVTSCAIVGVTLIAAQIVTSTLWLRAFHYGPLEWAWRCLTWGRLVPLRKTGAPLAAPSA